MHLIGTACLILSVILAFYSDLGNSAGNVPAKIVGGNSAGRAKYTEYAWIYFNGSFLCGGSIYDKKNIVTAAHCLIGLPEYYTVAVGKYKVEHDDDTEQYLEVNRLILHEGYSFPNHDIGLIRLKSKIQYNFFVQPAVLAAGAKQENLTNCYAVGAGVSVQNDDGTVEYPRVLQDLRTKFVSRKKCKKLMKKELDLPRSYVSNNMLCTYDDNAGVCFGDSGAPVGCVGEDETFVQVGLLSFGSTVCADGFNVFTRVSQYKKWLKNNA